MSDIFDMFNIDVSKRGKSTGKSIDIDCYDNNNNNNDNNDNNDTNDKEQSNINNILAKIGKKSISTKMAKTDMPIPIVSIENPIVQFSYPKHNFMYTRPRTQNLEPYTDSWVHDSNQTDDILTSENKKIESIVCNLLKTEYPAQRSPKWFELREGSITASDSGCVLGDNSHEPPYKIYVKKLLKPPFEASLACYHGTKLEQIATMVYEYRMNVKIDEFGLVKHPKYNFLAASPDGIIGQYKLNGVNKTNCVGRMLEIKCPAMRKIRDDDPFYSIQYYWDQVQLQLECCDLEECDFWQNTITEYKTRQEYIDDTDLNEPFRSKTTKMEKGCLIQLLPKSKLVQAFDDYDNVRCEFSKFLYPPKIDMTPLESDLWIVSTLTNLESVLIDEVMRKYEDEKKLIMDAIIKNNYVNFLKYMDTELQKMIEHKMHDNEWRFKGKPDGYVNKVKKSIREETTDKFCKEYMNEFPKLLMLPEKNIKFIMFLFDAILPKNKDKILNDKNVLVKIMNLNENPEFYKLIDGNVEFKFVCKMAQMLKDLEFPKNYTFDKVFYWRFEKTLCTTVKRDRKWFAKVLPTFEKVWKNIVFLRANKDAADMLFTFINDLPAKEIQHGKELKDNVVVEEFIDVLCNKPTEKSKIKEYEKTLIEMIAKYCKKIK
ncbi:YqaJ viral recombinase [Bodo saltans virus]|uniref:YqaJ viral recombinase n=1 Tax=Bodo saltans virus TaxID=2024608 RepID=A0A2H4UUV3_9VIRU|nr:YqaJ viral recombinase [Bodo saltans virus]ATZ80636.1 YqaJ viral recombinase [Bodo saltans virus]